MYLIMKRRECKYLLLLLMRKFNCLDKEIIKEQLKLKSDRTINNNGLMSIFWTQKVKLFYAALLANNSH